MAAEEVSEAACSAQSMCPIDCSKLPRLCHKGGRNGTARRVRDRQLGARGHPCQFSPLLAFLRAAQGPSGDAHVVRCGWKDEEGMSCIMSNEASCMASCLSTRVPVIEQHLIPLLALRPTSSLHSFCSMMKVTAISSIQSARLPLPQLEAAAA